MGLPCLVMLESLAHWVMSRGDLAFMLPTSPGPEWQAPCRVADMVDNLDALVLQGGADVCPQKYGEDPRRPEWAGDPRRDRYELALLEEFLRQRKPVLGICRGMQLLNVAMGGSLYQDIHEDHRTSQHRGLEHSPPATHEVRFTLGGDLNDLYPGQTGGRVLSVHHQCVKRLGRGLAIEAVSADDNLIEAIRIEDDEHFAWGLQWHPEIQAPGCQSHLDPGPILEYFRRVARQGAHQHRHMRRTG